MAICRYLTILLADVTLLACMRVVPFTFAFVTFVCFAFSAAIIIGFPFVFAFVTFAVCTSLFPIFVMFALAMVGSIAVG